GSSGDSVKLLRGDLDAVARAKDGDALVVRTHPARTDGQHLVFTKGELASFAEQAQNFWHGEDASTAEGTPYRDREPMKFTGQNSDTQLFFDPETRSFETWVFHPLGVSKIRIAMSETGEIEKFDIKYGVKPEAPHKVDLLLPPKLHELLEGNGGKTTIPVE